MIKYFQFSNVFGDEYGLAVPSPAEQNNNNSVDRPLIDALVNLIKTSLDCGGYGEWYIQNGYKQNDLIALLNVIVSAAQLKLPFGGIIGSMEILRFKSNAAVTAV